MEFFRSETLVWAARVASAAIAVGAASRALGDGRCLSLSRRVVLLIAGAAFVGAVAATLDLGILPFALGPELEWTRRFLAYVCGALILGPVLMRCVRSSAHRSRPVEAAAVFAALAAGCFFLFEKDSFQPAFPATALLLPFLIWPAFRLSPRSAAAAVLFFSAAAVAGTAIGEGPFGHLPPAWAWSLLGGSLASVAVVCLAVSAAVEEYRDADADLRAIRDHLDLKVELRTEQLRRKADDLAAVLDNSHDAIVSIDRNARISTWNPAAERIFGYQADEILGRHVSTIAPLELKGEGPEALAKLKLGSKVEILETRRRRKDGSEVEVSITASPITDVGRQVIGAVAIIRDLADRKNAREVQALREREGLRKEFVADLSHELRTPIAAIKGYAETLRLGALEDRDNRLDFVETIERHADHLTRLTESLLELSLIENGRRVPVKESVELRLCLHAVIATLAPAARKRGIRFVRRAGPHVRVSADSTQLEQVLINLCGNAIKYGRQGGVVELDAVASAEGVEISVRDDGPGIPAEVLPRIFDRFHRGARPGAGSRKGAGLGLAIAQGIVAAHGGRIWAESRPGEGSVFRFTLPAAGPEPAQASSL
jgi:PAS domain S-box-containing protein